jgi:hypothetical protein
LHSSRSCPHKKDGLCCFGRSAPDEGICEIATPGRTSALWLFQACDHFASRNAGIIVVLGNGSDSWISLCREGRIWRNHSGGMAETLLKLKDSLHGSEGETDLRNLDVEGFWQVYYDSQYCPERRNPAAFRRQMPRRDQEAAGLRLVQNKKNVTLDNFSSGE